MTRIAVISTRSTRRSLVVCAAMAEGFKALGIPFDLIDEAVYPKHPEHEIAVFYGLGGRLRKLFGQFREDGRKAVYIDLGWWMRKEPSFYEGYHKFAINGRHPTAYFRRRKHREDRFNRFGIPVRPATNRHGDSILLAGMGDKAASVEGFLAEEWERAAIKRIRELTDRAIIYRPKPSWKGAQPISGTTFSPPKEDLVRVLGNTRAVVTHHSNVAVDAQIWGIPTYSEAGVATAAGIGAPTIDRLVADDWPLASVEERRAWLADIAYAQWSVEEMRRGEPWRHLQEEGLV